MHIYIYIDNICVSYRTVFFFFCLFFVQRLLCAEQQAIPINSVVSMVPMEVVLSFSLTRFSQSGFIFFSLLFVSPVIYFFFLFSYVVTVESETK